MQVGPINSRETYTDDSFGDEDMELQKMNSQSALYWKLALAALVAVVGAVVVVQVQRAVARRRKKLSRGQNTDHEDAELQNLENQHPELKGLIAQGKELSAEGIEQSLLERAHEEPAQSKVQDRTVEKAQETLKSSSEETVEPGQIAPNRMATPNAGYLKSMEVLEQILLQRAKLIAVGNDDAAAKLLSGDSGEQVRAHLANLERSNAEVFAVPLKNRIEAVVRAAKQVIKDL